MTPEATRLNATADAMEAAAAELVTRADELRHQAARLRRQARIEHELLRLAQEAPRLGAEIGPDRAADQLGVPVDTVLLWMRREARARRNQDRRDKARRALQLAAGRWSVADIAAALGTSRRTATRLIAEGRATAAAAESAFAPSPRPRLW